MSPSQHALTIAAKSRFPIAYDGDGWLYWAVLFCFLIMSLVLLETSAHITKQIVIDRKNKCKALFWWRMEHLLICITAMLRVVPEAIYRIAWGEASPTTLQLILSTKEVLNVLAAGVLISWLLIYRFFEPTWTIRLNDPKGKVWGGNRNFIPHALTLTVLSAILAGSITFYKAFI